MAERTPELRSRRRVAQQSGAAAVEFALILPVYFLALFGFIQFSIVFFGYCNVAYATQMAVRYAEVHGNMSAKQFTSTDMTNIVTAYLWAAPSGSIQVTSSAVPDYSSGSTVTVKVSVLYNTVIPFFSLSTIPVGTSAQGTILY